MMRITLCLAAVLALCVCFACKRQAGGKNEPSGVSAAIEKKPDSACLVGYVTGNVVVQVPDTDMEKRLRDSGFVDIQETDPSVRVHLVYATAENFVGKVLYPDLRKAFLLPETARRLADAQKRLKAIRPQWGIVVYDAARPMSVQRLMWDRVKGTDLRVYVSNPANGGSLHNYGAAVDVSVTDSLGQALDMGSTFDFFGDEARPDREEEMLKQGRITAAALENRRLLRRVMKEAGFRPLHSEWWHFNLMSRDEARATLAVIP